MKRRILLLLLPILLTSCITQKKRLKICATCPVATIMVDSIIVKDTAIYIVQKGEIEYIESPCAELCDSFGNLIPFIRESTSNGIKTTIKTIGNVLTVECEVDSLKAIITLLERQRSSIITLPPVEVERKKTSLEKFQGYWFWICVVLGIGYGAFRVGKMYVR